MMGKVSEVSEKYRSITRSLSRLPDTSILSIPIFLFCVEGEKREGGGKKGVKGKRKGGVGKGNAKQSIGSIDALTSNDLRRHKVSDEVSEVSETAFGGSAGSRAPPKADRAPPPGMGVNL